MSRGRWTETDENLAQEAFAVLIQGQRATRTYPRARLQEALTEKQTYTDFIKLCVEYDETPDLTHLRRGLAFVVRSGNASEIAKKAGFSRVSLYRMLTKKGNPRFKNIIALLRVLDLRLWVVDASFVRRERYFVRPKAVMSDKLNMKEAPAINPKSIRGYS